MTVETVFVSRLKTLLDAIATERKLYTPQLSGQNYIFNQYSPDKEVEFNSIRPCGPVKEFLFPAVDLAAVYPKPAQSQDVEPFAVFGLKQCDIRSIEVIDKVFIEDEFEDTDYTSRREKMFIIASDCLDVGDS